jgi:DNA topoisomerase-1
MAKYLVIVESPEKAKKIGGYLGKDYKVMASVGHVIDLPAKGLNVDIKKDFKPKYGVMPGKEDIVKTIIAEAKNVDIVYLMSDPDREGEAISFHISKQLPKDIPFKRAKTNSITKQAIVDAITNATDIDYDLVDSYETRRILDRLVGYKCSFITTSATGGKSAGRVQSAALRVLSEREKEIKAFVPQEYWEINADLLTSKKDKISAHITRPDKMDIKTQQEADKIVAALQGKTLAVSKYDTKEVYLSARAPFTTSTLQQTAASLFGWDQDRTMRIAQKLYEDGHITYMRTDSVTIVPNVIAAIRSHIQSNYKPNYLPKTANFYANKAAAQAAHEAIRPVDVTVDQVTADAEGRKLYDLIWRRTISSQMEKAKNLSVTVRFTKDEYEFGASGSVSLFDGWKNVYHWSAGDDKLLPQLAVGEVCDIEKIEGEQKFTQPPSRYTKSSITKMYEETGIGRPSTYANITKTLKAREYIELIGSSYQVTDLGLKVCDFLLNSKFCFMDLNFTSDMEEKLDKIGDKELKKLNVLTEFWDRLKGDIDNATKIKQSAAITNHDCPKCKQKLLAKHGKFGAFFACPNKECKFTANVDENGNPKERVVVEKVYCEHPCQLCNSKMVLRKGKLGDFYGCETYPKCRGMRTAAGEIIEPKVSTGKRKFFRKFKGKK